MRKSLAFTLIFTLLLTGCNQQPAVSESEPPTTPEVASDVLATVNGEPITQADVDFMIERTFSSAEQFFFDDTMQAKVLDSLIASKAMQQSMRQTLSSNELQDIENRTRAYKEELYIKAYLQQHASPEPVSTTMVQEYYQQYPEEFGGGEQRDFELLSTTTKPKEEQRDAILQALGSIQAMQDWPQYARSNELGLTYKKASMAPNLFDPALESALRKLQAGESSDVVFVKGVPHILRVLKIKTIPAKPLSEVSADIRKKLAAMQLKKAVKSASEEAVSQAEVIRN